jgi:hypothetical protein
MLISIVILLKEYDSHPLPYWSFHLNLNSMEPRLGFEGEWATDWVLKKLIDQRVADAKRVGGQRTRESARPMGNQRARK